MIIEMWKPKQQLGIGLGYYGVSYRAVVKIVIVVVFEI